jgi:hypothetical protein
MILTELTPDQMRFARAYYAHKLHYDDREPTCDQYNIREVDAEAIARFIQKEIESERVKQARAFKPK